MAGIRPILLLIAVFSATQLNAAEIEGLVRSSVQNKPVVTATVQLMRSTRNVVQELFVGSSGQFAFRNLGLGSYIIRVHAEGFSDREESIIITKSYSREVLQIEINPVQVPVLKRENGVVSVFNLNIPDSARREYERGLKERDKNGCKGGAQHFEKAIQIHSTYTDALNEMGKCYREAGKLDLAETSFQQAIEYGTSIFPYINLADLLVSGKRFQGAHSILDDGIAKFPGEGDLYFALSNAFFEEGRMAEAEKAGLQAHERSHAAADVHLLLAKIYVSMERYQDVTSQLQTYLVENPDGPVADRVRQNLAQLERN